MRGPKLKRSRSNPLGFVELKRFANRCIEYLGGVEEKA